MAPEHWVTYAQVVNSNQKGKVPFGCQAEHKHCLYDLGTYSILAKRKTKAEIGKSTQGYKVQLHAHIFKVGRLPYLDLGSAKKKRVSTRKRSHRRPMNQPPAVTGSMLMGPTEVWGRYERGRASKGPHAMPTALDVTKAVHHRCSHGTT